MNYLLNIPSFYRHFFVLLVSVFLQVTLFEYLKLMNRFDVFVFLFFIATLPFTIGRVRLLLLGGLCGFVLDLLLATSGLFTMVSLFVSYVRPVVVRMFYIPASRHDKGIPSAHAMGLWRFISYLLILSFIFTLTFYLLEDMSFQNFNYVLEDAAVSSLITVPILLFMQLILLNQTSRR